MMTIKIIRDKLSAKYDIINVQSNQNEDKESEKALYIRQIKEKCYKYGTYGHKSRYFTERKKNNKISTVRTAKRAYTPFKNVTARISLIKYSCTVTRRVTNKRSSGRNK